MYTAMRLSGIQVCKSGKAQGAVPVGEMTGRLLCTGLVVLGAAGGFIFPKGRNSYIGRIMEKIPRRSVWNIEKRYPGTQRFAQ
jgi:hypothetical protein